VRDIKKNFKFCEENLKGIAIIGGEGPKSKALKKLAKLADLIVAADSGLVACEEAGIAPDWIVGDMDSLDNPQRLEKYPPERVIRHPGDKDFSDTELALSLLWEKGCGEVWLAGGGGGRTDHLLAIRSLFERQKAPDRWFTAGEEIIRLKEGQSRCVDAAIGGVVSVFPLGKGPWQAESAGLKWPLNGVAWKSGGFSLSNVAQEAPFELRSKKGEFMVIVSKVPCTIK
jgi:thiamine pyrophosphokinase